MSIMIPGVGRVKDQSVATAAQWAASTVIIPEGTAAIESDDGSYKVGTGTAAYADLPYEPGKAGDPASGGGSSLPTIISGGAANTVFTLAISGGNASAP